MAVLATSIFAFSIRLGCPIPIFLSRMNLARNMNSIKIAYTLPEQGNVKSCLEEKRKTRLL